MHRMPSCLTVLHQRAPLVVLVYHMRSSVSAGLQTFLSQNVLAYIPLEVEECGGCLQIAPIEQIYRHVWKRKGDVYALLWDLQR